MRKGRSTGRRKTRTGCGGGNVSSLRLQYDEQFRQRMSVPLELSWDHRDIGIWFRVMNSKAGVYLSGAGVSSFQPSAVPAGPGAPGGGQKGFCWAFNDSQCKWVLSCKFKHECYRCGGNHPGEPFGKRDEPGDRSGNGPVA